MPEGGAEAWDERMEELGEEELALVQRDEVAEHGVVELERALELGEHLHVAEREVGDGVVAALALAAASPGAAPAQTNLGCGSGKLVLSVSYRVLNDVVISKSALARIIEEHLELKRKNSELDGDMPLDRYRVDDPFNNHPLFKSEEQARVEDTLSGVDEIDPNKVLAWPTDDSQPQDPEDTLWGRSRDFDWGD